MATGSLRQVEHLAERGHTTIAFAGTHEHRLRWLSDGRRLAVRHRARELGLKVAGGASITLRSPATRRTITRWLSTEVTAVTAFNDDTAAAIVAAALDLGVRVPQDLAVIVHDDSLLAALYRPPLSSVRIDYRSIGHYMAEVALATARGVRPDEIPVPGIHAEAVHRGTT
ncbi:substrate-binding domain-containing protein [Nonomuraea sp. 10N515B]|uniref:substrate-binding domain-containing protein n=1 Tax=Nonomuraea sp. 10N515B TaxID=3457422 RepID=UPI003FCDDC26